MKEMNHFLQSMPRQFPLLVINVFCPDFPDFEGLDADT